LATGISEGSTQADAQAAAEHKAREGLDATARAAEGSANDNRSPADKEKWTRLVDYVADHGESEENNMGFYVSLKDESSQDRSKSRTATYFSVVGGPGEGGHFSYTRVESSSEVWTVTTDGNLRGDQWMFLLSRDGQIAKYWHYHFLETKDGRVLEHKSQPVTLAQAQEKWAPLLAKWMSKVESKSNPL